MSGADKDAREAGLGLMGQVLGEGLQDGLTEHIASSDFGRECGTWAADFAYGTVWNRPGLDRRMRSCVVMGILMALRQTDELRYHVRIALANGLSRAELEEVLYLAVPYAGFPAANSAKQAMIAVLREIDAEAEAKPTA